MRVASASRPARLLLAAGLFLLSACAGRPPSTAVPAEREWPPISYPASMRARIVEIAEREWRDFGGTEIDFSTGTANEVYTGLRETDPRIFPNILAYWNAVRGRWAGYIREEKSRYQAGQPAWTAEAWSAVFVSYVMRTAGIDGDDFPWDAGHRNYIDALIERQARYGVAAAFQPYDLEQYAPRRGDLICADRSRPADARITTVADRAAEIGSSRGMHCDIVTVVEAGRVGAIGGNVADSVSRSWFPTDGYGRLLRGAPNTGNGERTFFTVIQLNVPDPAVASAVRLPSG